MTEHVVRRSVDADVSLHSLEVVHDEFTTWVAEIGDLSPQVRFAFETAVIEIAGNIVEHSGDPEGTSGRRFTLDLVGDADVLHATFQDNGIPAGVDLRSVSMADVDEESGRGLALATASLDKLEYAFENGRNVWRLECRRG